jgi:hypothetical protein
LLNDTAYAGLCVNLRAWFIFGPKTFLGRKHEKWKKGNRSMEENRESKQKPERWL